MWLCTNRIYAENTFSHFVYCLDHQIIAIADHSIEDMNDPCSTEDGLLIVDFNRSVIADEKNSDVFLIPVIRDDGELSKSIVSRGTLEQIRKMKDRQLNNQGWIA